MCPQTPSLSPEYSHKAGLQAVITSMPLQIRPVTQRRPRRARYNGPDHTWASELNEAVLRDGVAAGLRPVPNRAKGVPARFVSVRPATAAKASSEGWRLCLRPNTHFSVPCSANSRPSYSGWLLIPRRTVHALSNLGKPS